MKTSHNVGPNGEIVDFCTTCRHMKLKWTSVTFFGVPFGEEMMCGHPNFVSGVDRSPHRKCKDLRDGQASACGTYGRYHEPK